MTTEALERLIEAVEAGGIGWNGVADISEAAGIGLPHSQVAASAYNGDLNAARALHDALLPGWKWGVSHDDPTGLPYEHPTFWVQSPDRTSPASFFRPSGMNPEPARAWLLAILRAKLAEANSSDPRQITSD